MPAGAVSVTRGPNRKWGNPFAGDAEQGRDNVYLRSLFAQLCLRPERADFRAQVRAELRGRDLACFCAEGTPCHGDVLLELANSDTPDLTRFL